MRFKKVAVMVMAVSLFMTSFTAGSSYASANETADTQIEGMILKSENVNIEETTVVQSVATSSSISDKSDTKASNKKTTKAKKTTKKRKKKKYSKSDLRLMASIINCVAVGIVVMNRVSSKSFPNSIKGVIYQKGQFSPVRNGSLKKRLKQYDAKRTGSKQWKSCISAAKRVLQGQKTILYRGKTKNMKSFHFFSVYLAGARMKLGGHKFK